MLWKFIPAYSRDIRNWSQSFKYGSSAIDTASRTPGCLFLPHPPSVLLCNLGWEVSDVDQNLKKKCAALQDERRWYIFSTFSFLVWFVILVWDSHLRNTQGKLVKLVQLLEEMLSELRHVYLFEMKFFNDAVILFWIQFGWKVLRLFLHWTEFQTSGSCR